MLTFCHLNIKSGLMRKTLKFLFPLLFVSPLFAEQDITVQGTIVQEVPQNHHRIELLDLKLSSPAKHVLAERLQHEDFPQPIRLQNKLSARPSQIQLGMNKVPPLDQGPHGTCATFATVAALDAMTNKGDYISPLCLLTINEYLAAHARTTTLWDGGFPKQIFNLASMFGIVNMSNQQKFGCGGMTQYPKSTVSLYPQIDVDNYYAISENLQKIVRYDTTNIFDVFQFIYEERSIASVEANAKSALAHGDRLTLGIMIAPDDSVGAHGSYHKKNDTWVLSDKIKTYFESGDDIGGHALVLTGYNDNADVIDDEGKKHHGLFTVRNSWGPSAGDNGDYYISYDYFRALLIDLVRLRKLEP
jgi:hypothetical protein